MWLARLGGFHFHRRVRDGLDVQSRRLDVLDGLDVGDLDGSVRFGGLDLFGRVMNRGGGTLGLVDRLRGLVQARRAQRRRRRFGGLGTGLLREDWLPRGRLGGGPFGEHIAAGQRHAALAGQALDELPADDLFDGARRALHVDAVIALQQRHHFLAGRVQQFRDFVDPNSGQTVYLGLPLPARRAGS